MQTTKTLLLTCLLFLGMVLSKTTLGQSVANLPTTFTTVPNGNQNYSSISFSDSSSWFKWQTDSTVISINLKMLTANGRYGIKKARLFVEKNGHLENLSHQDLNLTDSTIFYFIQHLNINDNLYLNVQTEIKCSGCGSTPPTASLSFALLPQGCQLYNQPSCELVKDGGFEFFNMNCNQIRTIGPGQNWASCFWYFPNSSIFPGTSDYFNSCAPITIPNVLGYGNTANTTVNAFSQGLPGLTAHNNTSGYGGIFTYISGVASPISAPNDQRTYREYIVNKLNAPLVTGKTYIVSMYVRLSNASRYAIDNLGMLFTNNIPVQPMNASVPSVISSAGGQFIPTFNGYTPVTNKTGWTLLTTTISATASYDHITIGNFRPNNLTGVTDLNQAGWTTTTPGNAGQFPNVNTFGDMAYYYIDDVSIRPIDLKVSPDVSICTPSVTPLTSTLSCAPSGATVTYTWAPTNGLSSINTASTQASPTVTTTYTLSATVTFTNSDGTVSIINLSDDVKVTVTNSGSFSLTATANPSVICLYAGSSSTLSTNAGANLSYTWTNGATTYTVPNPVVSPTVTTTYTVTTINCGVTYTAVTTVIVDTPPIISVSSNTVCNETAVSVTTPTNTSITYIDFGDPTSTSNVINPHIYSATGNYSITINTSTSGSCNTQSVIPISVVTATSSSIAYTVIPCSYNYTIAQVFNCSNITDGTFFEIYSSNNPTLNIAPTSSVVGGSFPFTFPGAGTYTITAFSYPTELYTQTTITVLAVSPPTVSIVAAPSKTICAGNSATLTASGVSTYTWMPGAVNGNTIAVTPTVTTTYTVTGTNAQGCIDTETITITVVPNLTLTATASPTAICSGQSSTLTASGATSYTWMPSGATTSVTVVSPTVTTIYTVTGSNGTCVNTKTVQVVVSPTPTININPLSPTTVCVGTSVVLQGSGASTYTWSAPACTVSCNNAVKSFVMNATTIFTLNGTNAQGCVGTKTIQITAVPKPTVTVNSATICAGSSATLTASGSSTYTWSPIASNSSSIIVTPSVTTIYTVQGYNTGCGFASTATSTVTVVPNTPIFSVISSSTSPVINNGTGTNVVNLYTSITNTTGLLFDWQPSGSTTPTIAFNLTQPEIISVSVYNQVCNTTTTQSICLNYVSSTCSGTFATLNNATITNTATLGSGAATYYVTGTLTINWTTPSNALEYKTFIMATGSKVEITATTDITLNNIKFYSCNDMWRGIEIKTSPSNAARVTISGDQNSIEDAYMGIYCINPSGANLNPTISCDLGVLFNKNYYDVYIENTKTPTTAYPFNFRKSRMYSQSTNNSPGGNLKCSGYYTPTVKSRSYAGVYALNAGIIDFNANANPIDYNQVKNKDYGLYFNNTNANVNNVAFSDAVGYANTFTLGTLPVGVGVYSKNSGYLNVKPANAPTTGITTTFVNLGYQVVTNNTYTVDVQNTSYTTSVQGFTVDPSWLYKPVWNYATGIAGYGLNGVFATNARDVLRVNNNTFTNNYYPATANYTVAPSSTNTMSIAQNTINTTNVNGVREGVTFNSALSFTPTANNMRIAANTFSNVTIGVKVTSASIGLRISNNTFTIHPTATNPKAIYMAGSNTVTVDNNSIYGSLTSAAVNAWNVNHHGILCENSPGCKVKCNTISNVGVGVEYRGGNTSSGDGFFNNTLKYPIRRGLFISNGGIIGTQGSSAGASANQWINGTSSWPAAATADPNKTSVGGTISGGSSSQSLNSILYVRNNANELPNDNYFTSPSGIADIYSTTLGSLLTTTGGNYTTCPTTLASLKVTQSGNTNTTERDADFVNYINTVLPSSNNDVSPQDKFMLKQFMFDDLTQNPSTDMTLQAFYNQQQNTSVDVYHEIDSLLANGYINAANTKNAQASQSNDITQTQNAYNALYINGINSKADLDNLSSIADLCPQLYGNAVYQARALLQSITYVGKVYADSCDNSKVRNEMWLDDEPTSISLTDGVQAKLYPNPNNGSFTLAYDLKKNNDAEVLIYDVTGKEVYKTSLDNLENMKQINTNNLHNGIYFIQLIHDKNLLWTDKLIISK